MSVQAFALVYGAPFIALWLLARRQTPELRLDRERLWLLLWLAAGLLLRLPLLWDAGFHYDTSTYKAWALKLSDPAAPWRIYQPGYFADYPPLYMYVLGSLGHLARGLGLEGSAHFTALIKLPALLADMAVAWLLLRATPPSGPSRGLPLAGFIAASLYWLNPAVIFDGAYWGQTEAILGLLLVLAWQHWRDGRLWAASLALGAAVAFKPQGLVFAYVYGLALLVSAPWRETLRQGLIGLASFGLIILPFALGRDLDWILRLYFATAETYSYLTVNAYNLWALFGWNWSADPGALFGITLQWWAGISSALALSALAVVQGRRLAASGTPAARGVEIAWLFGLAALLFFMFAPRMHERYILPLLPMLALLGPRGAVPWLLLGWSATALANMGYVLHYYVELDKIAPADTAVIRLISALNLLLSALTLLAWRAPHILTRLWRKPSSLIADVPALPQVLPDRQPQRPALILPYLVLGGAALLLGASQLGSRETPQTGARLDKGEFLLRYEAPVDPALALIYTGPGEGRIRLDAQTAEGWRPLLAETEVRTFYEVKQLALEHGAPSRTLRLSLLEVTDNNALRLNELALFDANGQALVPVAVEGPQPAASLLTDEPARWQADQGYYASTYFDEIYHGRTAYEYLNHLWIYETTHPPLGKWLIAQGIKVFGMNPFGMRIAGVVATSAVVLALIWGAWLLTGRLNAMWLAGLLGLFEFSRFAIGRYSTIDGFLILFLLLAALLLWRAFGQPRQWLDGWRASPGLLLAGACLGAAIATKWSALYFGIAVFGFFLFSLVQTQLALPAPQRLAVSARIVLAGALAFGLIPLAIYLLSYIPFLRGVHESPSLFSWAGLKAVWANQTYMFGYHSDLDSTHAFSSAFYTWPLTLKPLWLYVSETREGLRSSISLLGNPLIWWSGAVAVLALLSGRLHWPTRQRLWLLACIGALYLPWAGVSRVSFIYHYFPVVPFLILLLAVSLDRLPRETRAWRAAPWAFAGAAGVLFIWFYPALSGVWAPKAWFASLRWLPGWWML